MADNVTLNAGSGGSTIAADDISSVLYPRSKIVIGADGTNDGDVSATNPLPIKGTGTAGTANAGVVTIQGIASMTAVQVGDNSGSLTVDAPVATPVFVRLSDGAAAISTLPVSLASVPSHAVTNAGTFAVQVDGAALTALQLIDDAVFTDDAAFTPATSKVMMVGAEFDDTTPDSVDEGDAGALRMSARRELYSQIRDAAGNERGANVNASNELLVALSSVPSHAVTNAGTFAVQAAQSGTWNITNISGTVSLPTGAATAAKQPALGTAGTASADVITIQGIASMTAVKVDGSAVTQPVSAASLPLPTGASTAAKQPALGTAGSASADVITVQGVASMTPVLVTLSGTNTVNTVTTVSTVTSLTQFNGNAIDTNSGNKSAGTLRVVLATDQPTMSNAQPVTVSAGTALIGKVAASAETTSIYDGTTALTPKFAIIAEASANDNEVVAAVVSKKIRVLSYVLVANAAVNAKWRSATTDKSGLLYLAANGGVAAPYSPVGHLETAAGEALNLHLSGAIAVGGHVTYIEV